MTMFSEIVEKGQIFICDNCKKDIPADKVKLTEPIDNCKVWSFTMPFVFVDKDGIITGGSKMAKKDIGDKVLCCPYCDTVHLFGFDVKK